MKHIFILALLCPFLTHCMPHRNTTPPLSVGDAYSAFTVHNIINSKASSLSIPSSGNTIYILNFVAIACKSCYKDYARLDALQKQFAGNIRILLITAEDSGRVHTFLKTNKIGKALNLPVATSDTLLASWFPHQYLSHTVWLQNGTVIGITDPEYIDENNIEILLLGHQPRWPLKTDSIAYNASLPLLTVNPQAVDKKDLPLPFYTAFTEHIGGLPSSFSRTADSASASVKTTILNQTIIGSYLHAYNLGRDFPLSGVVLNVADTARYIYSQSNGYKMSWEMQNTFCYQSVLPSSLTRQQQQQKLITDLDFYFGIHSCYKKIKAACFALKSFDTAGAKPLLTSGVSPDFISLSNLVWYINHNWFGIPAFNETGLPDRTFIPFNEAAFSNYQSLQPYLKQYGLHLSFTEREVDLLSLTEVAPNQSRNKP
jgi:hypothetical protein